MIDWQDYLTPEREADFWNKVLTGDVAAKAISKKIRKRQ